MFTIQAAPLERLAERIFVAMGSDEDVAAEVARHLVLSNLSGHDSHGVQRIPQYVELADHSGLVPRARPEIILDGPASVLVDAHLSFGQFSTQFTLERCIDKASDGLGLAVGAIRHSTHTGRMGYYSEAATARGLICLATTGAVGPDYSLVAPFGGAEKMLGTNPWTIGVPAGPQRTAFIFDAATTTIAEGKNKLALLKGESVPPGTVLDATGMPTNDPSQLYAGGSLTLLGGNLAGHKGFGYSLAAALFGLLASIDNLNWGSDVVSDSATSTVGVFLLLVSPAVFGDSGRYQELVAHTLDQTKAVHPSAGVREVLYAGEPEARSRRRLTQTAIRLPDTVWNQLGAVAERFGLELPRT